MRWLVTSILLCSCCVLHAQGKWGIRLNQNTDFFSVTYTETDMNTLITSSNKEREVRIGRISAAVSYLSGEYTQELELFVPQVNGSSPTFPWPHDVRINVNTEHKYSSYAARYMISRNVYSLTKSLSLSLGGGLNAYCVKDEIMPRNEYAFPVSDYSIGMSLNVIPGVNLKASEHFSFLLDCPLKVFDVYHKTVNTRNPAIPVRRQKERSFETDFFMNAVTVRLGVAYQFGKG